jgi:hypothetical protein
MNAVQVEQKAYEMLPRAPFRRMGGRFPGFAFFTWVLVSGIGVCLSQNRKLPQFIPQFWVGCQGCRWHGMGRCSSQNKRVNPKLARDGPG